VQRQAYLEKATSSFSKRWLLKRAWTLFTGLDEVLAEKLKMIRERAKHYAFKAYAQECLTALNDYRLDVQKKR
jgi:hypothetical protein